MSRLIKDELDRKEKQKKLLEEIMQEDEKDGIYDYYRRYTEVTYHYKESTTYQLYEAVA